ncbi:thiosulfate oxidation carrier protein SoxY [Ralstonia insidiosa]|uniref:Thiosulfate oxidation carrier protein SoxY n=1 Tax=Ralstonia insidiosa TaxID=190721 RepID=A0A192A146_9RALS|nr:thiosulfate oxidation carrier protein SoxY [Ralstonia insidiosa]ANJ74011.1 thiosulfate oxidation carrier protein SoxY [Ralstonia insidiosa]KAB0471223.1 thiosulfate oxidation carrier protein SoxY [Ralstonia insidiosa]MBY4909258.1 thiosulfate oxidation carrier protein SoxY [Ralstonia insidiosa]NMV41469.1 thiosulfate oxidation carrier protein SoxY [Ralstonia insidiosa]
MTDSVNLSRRDVLRAGAMMALLVSAGLATPAQAAEWNKAAFAIKGVNDVLKQLGGGAVDKGGAGIQLTAPDIAENGAVVPLVVTSTLPGTDLIAILVEKNPNTLAATFAIPAGTDPFVSTRVKMGETSMVYAAVRANGKWVLASKEVKVTLGGCGG